ncbi:hypothetical protein Aph01nite_10510 [Acrocarpospora phusangensis]|uniref:Tat pathway signal sequence domain protein n=1 Tax=Acrocarpospora phusangensis TaxID=1070424 RepID=A0A919UIJ2_9ACTN|nr:hypothetical protein [Acrocarpospora phusangensis]GIH22741.1 hypothetical protein Aph01nite_10510 [Acrocarpospora phusangensis]
MNRLVFRIGRVAVFGAVLTALSLAATPANAMVPTSATLKNGGIVAGTYSYRFHVDAVFGMSQTEARRLQDRGHKLQIRLWGDDQFTDDLLWGPFIGNITPTPNGAEFHTKMLVPEYLLNEDAELEIDRDDEMYVGIRLIDAAGKTVRSVRTNTITLPGDRKR